MTARNSSPASPRSPRGTRTRSSTRGPDGQGDQIALEQATIDRLQAVHDTLTRAVADLAHGDAWQRMLRTAARFHHYSPHNVLLITVQCPQAEAVAGYQTWKQLDRQVRKGEKGIAILAPVVRRRSPDSPAGPGAPAGPGSDPALQTLDTHHRSRQPTDIAGTAGAPGADQQTNQQPNQQTNQQTNQDGKARRLSGFRVVHVFDISQTDGPPLPTQPLPELLDGQAPEGLLDALTLQVTNAGYRLTIEPITAPHPGLSGANGVTDYLSRTVTVRPGMSAAQTVKTLAHELGHVLLHSPDQRPAGLTREQAEVEAESVAYVIGAAHGLDTSGYTIPYVTGWASADLDLIRGTAERVLTTARQVLAAAPPGPAFELHERPDGSRTLAPAERAPLVAVLDNGERDLTRENMPEPRRDATPDHEERTVDVADAIDLNALDRAVDTAVDAAVDESPIEAPYRDRPERPGQQLLFAGDPEPASAGDPTDGPDRGLARGSGR